MIWTSSGASRYRRSKTRSTPTIMLAMTFRPRHDDPANTGPILFFDGDCGLCTRAVQWCLTHDHKHTLRFAPLQGSTYAAVTNAGKPTELNTLVLLDEDGLHVRSSGALRMIGHL